MTPLIAQAIGWKFNHQPGMETRNGEITAFPGGIPSKAEQDAWVAEYTASAEYKEQQVKNDSDYPSGAEFNQALMDEKLGNALPMTALIDRVNSIKSKHGV